MRLAANPETTPDPTPRQQEILDRAVELVREAGLVNLTLKKVAERVGFTEAAIYRHFANKQALVVALFDRFRGFLLGPISEIAADASLPPRERLQRMVRHHVGVLMATEGLPILIIAEGLASGDRELIERVGGVIKDYRGLLAELLAELRLPLAAPPMAQSILFFGLPAALAITLRARPDLAPRGDELERLVRFYVEALTRPAGDGEEKTA